MAHLPRGPLEAVAHARTLRWFIGILCMAVQLAGCASRSPSTPSLEKITDSSSPFALSVLSERYDGTTLALQLALESRTYWEPKQLLFEVQTLHEGLKVARYRYRLTDLVSPTQLSVVAEQNLLAPGTRVEFPLIVRSPEASDYQISIAWGDDAKVDTQVLDTPPAEVALSQVAVRTIPIICPERVCDVHFRIEAVLENRSPRVVQEVALAVAYRASGDTAPRAADAEVPVTVSDLGLAPGARREVLLDLEQQIPPETAQRILPVVRVVSAR